MRERLDDDGMLRLALSGELDLAVADELVARLQELRNSGRHLRLAELGFIDSTGLRELIVAVSDSRRDGWKLEIGTEVSEPVRRVIDLIQARSHLWPDRG